MLGDRRHEGPIPLTCGYFDELKWAKWSWTDPFSNEAILTLPECAAECKDDPPLNRDVIRTNWTKVMQTKLGSVLVTFTLIRSTGL